MSTVSKTAKKITTVSSGDFSGLYEGLVTEKTRPVFDGKVVLPADQGDTPSKPPVTKEQALFAFMQHSFRLGC